MGYNDLYFYGTSVKYLEIADFNGLFLSLSKPFSHIYSCTWFFQHSSEARIIIWML